MEGRTTIIQEGQKSVYQDEVERLVFNMLNTVDMSVDFRKPPGRMYFLWQL